MTYREWIDFGYTVVLIGLAMLGSFFIGEIGRQRLVARRRRELMRWSAKR